MLGDGVLESTVVLAFIWIVTIASKSHLFTASVLLLMMETRNFIAFTCVLVSFLIQSCAFSVVLYLLLV